jgi:hypothetical protein
MSRFVGGWARHATRVLKQEKPSLSSNIDELEAITEVRPVTMREIDHLKSQYNAKFAWSAGRGGTQIVPVI